MVAENGDVTVNTYAGGGVVAGGDVVGTNTGGLEVTTVNTGADATTLTDRSATYTGTAAGMSLHKEVDGDGVAVPGTLQSGAFTADVTLTAKFGTAPTLGGYINGFEGYAVDPGWKVTLVQGAFTGATLEDGTTTTPNGQDGEWSAIGYGTSGARPTGIFGGFNAHFSDGHAGWSVRYPEIVLTETGSRTPFPRKGGHLRRPSFFRQFGGGHHGMRRTSSGGFGLEALECLMSFQ